MNKEVLEEIIKTINQTPWGSIEIFVQNGKIVQIIQRNIKKVKNE